MAFKYEGYDKYLRRRDGPATRRSQLPGYDFSSAFDVQAKRVRASQLQIENLVKVTGQSSISGTAGTGDYVTLTTQLEPSGAGAANASRRLMGSPYVIAYEGTEALAANQIYPTQGAAIGFNDYRVMSGYSGVQGENIDETYQVTVFNDNAGNVDILFNVHWKFIQNREGDVS